MTTALIIEDPGRRNYDEFFEVVISRLPLSIPGVEIFVKNRINSAELLEKILVKVYTQTRAAAKKRGFPDGFSIDVLVNAEQPTRWTQVYVPDGESGAGEKVACEVHALGLSEEAGQISEKHFPVAALGGTFDHLHDGHKILLTVAAYVAHHVIVGVTGPKLLVKKKYSEWMELLDVRMRLVMEFFRRVSPTVDFRIYEINDVYGPTGFLRAIDALVISDETTLGAQAVNKHRAELGLEELFIISVDVLGGSEADGWAGKLSSTEIRRGLAESV